MSDQNGSNQSGNGGSPKNTANEMINKATTWCKENPILAVVIAIVVLLILWAVF